MRVEVHYLPFLVCSMCVRLASLILIMLRTAPPLRSFVLRCPCLAAKAIRAAMACFSLSAGIGLHLFDKFLNSGLIHDRPADLNQRVKESPPHGAKQLLVSLR